MQHGFEGLLHDKTRRGLWSSGGEGWIPHRDN